MNSTDTHAGHLVELAKRIGQRRFAIGESRLELQLVEAQEARKRVVHALLRFLSVTAFRRGRPCNQALEINSAGKGGARVVRMSTLDVTPEQVSR